MSVKQMMAFPIL